MTACPRTKVFHSQCASCIPMRIMVTPSLDYSPTKLNSYIISCHELYMLAMAVEVTQFDLARNSTWC